MKRSDQKKQSRELLLQQGLTLIRSQGYHGTGIQEIVNAVGLPKGSFYNYFESKESFVTEVVGYFAQRSHESYAKIRQETPDPRECIKIFFVEKAEKIIESDFQGGCILGNLSNELSNQQPEVQQAIAKELNKVAALIAESVKEGQQAGLINQKMSPSSLADLILNAWEGALIRVNSSRSKAPFDQFFGEFLEFCLGP